MLVRGDGTSSALKRWPSEHTVFTTRGQHHVIGEEYSPHRQNLS